MQNESVVKENFSYWALSVENHKHVNGLEGFREFFTSVYDSAKNGFDLFFKKLTGFKTIELNHVPPAKLLFALMDSEYEDVENLMLACPAGLTSSVVDWSNEANAQLSWFASEGQVFIREMRTHAGAIISSKMTKQSLNDTSGRTLKLAEQREAMADAFSAQYDVKRNHSSAKYSALFGTGKSAYKDAYAQVVGVVDKLNAINVDQLKGDIEGLTRNVDTIVELVESGEIDFISPEQVNNLYKGVFEAAKQAEYFGLMLFRVQAMAQAMEDQVATFQKRFKY